MSTTIEIACAKPDCHWTGSPGDAAAHTCPTPAAEASPFAGLLDAEGKPVADSTPAGEREDFWAVWTDGSELRIIGTRKTEDEAVELANSIAPKIGQMSVRQIVKPDTNLEEEDDDAVSYDADPTDRTAIEAWLLQHGNYDDAGVPQDEKTATIDARLVAFLEHSPDPDPEPELDEPLEGPITLDAEAGFVPGSELPASDFVPVELARRRPMEVVIAEALESQPAVKEYRWLVVWTPADATREAELIGRGKVKNEAVIVAEDVKARGTLQGPVEVVKTADVLKAAEIEKKRILVEEPDVKVESPKPDEPELDDPPPAEPEKTAADAVAEAQAAQPKDAKPALFNAADFDREDLALPKVDGHPIDRIAVAFGGELMLDRSDPSHVALWRRLKLGRSVELWITAKGKGFAGTGATNRDGDLDVVVGKRSVTVEAVRILEPEELENAADEMRAQARDAHEAGEDGLEEVGGDA